ncbi:MAG: PTS sugar transporter subunit IIA [Granulosicoccus sp.]
MTASARPLHDTNHCATFAFLTIGQPAYTEQQRMLGAGRNAPADTTSVFRFSRCALRLCKDQQKVALMDLSDLLAPDRIRCLCDAKSKKRTLQTVAELLGESLRASALEQVAAATDNPDADTSKRSTVRLTKKILKTWDKGEDEPEVLTDMGILDALISRERLGSTGLGHGVGLPHSRLCAIDEPVAAFVSLESGIDYDAADSVPVDLVLGLLVPEHCNDEHLKILANLAKRFNEPAFRDKLREFTHPQTLFDYISEQPPVI